MYEPEQPTRCNKRGGEAKCQRGKEDSVPFRLHLLQGCAFIRLIENVCASKGFKAPIICTPEEMMEVKP